ncbi:unnamed protein product [Colletotrichum noveboracense]|uniref:Ribosomal protein S21 n=1 Tax=Colletotrichum noveboracense TaxID=2664923 RepID=A0A9W4WJD5_9PEZI|nr:unnamed protein product [Colletotrichum noveboracense]
MWSGREYGDTLIRVSSCPSGGHCGRSGTYLSNFRIFEEIFAVELVGGDILPFCATHASLQQCALPLGRVSNRHVGPRTRAIDQTFTNPYTFRASEIGLLSRRLLTSCSLRNTSLRSSQLASQPLWLQPRTFSTSRTLFNNESLFGVKGPLAENPQSSTTASSTSSSPTAAAKKKPHTPFAYDATSSNFDISQLIAMDSDDFMMKHHAAGQQEIELRTRPQTGRTIHVTGSRDFSAAMKALDVSTKRNRIKSLWHGQKFHERPGMRRKRLRRERSIKRYKEGFVATVRRVQELTNQGW